LQALPRCLVKLPKLSTLVASHNPIAELPGGISKLTGLLDLHMAHCALKAVPQVRFAISLAEISLSFLDPVLQI
jgi:Leucine-rich repeat (LRR) protein